MPKKIDPKVKERCVQQMRDHVAEYPNPTAAAEVVAKRNGVGAETVRRWNGQSLIDGGVGVARHAAEALHLSRESLAVHRVGQESVAGKVRVLGP